MSKKEQWSRDLWSIENLFDGNVDRFLKEDTQDWMINTHFGGSKSRYEQARAKGRERALDWQSIQTYGDYLPEYQKAADGLIYSRLGYEVDQDILIPHAPFIRNLLQNYKMDMISLDTLKDKADTHVKQIRNRDCELGGWIEKNQYDERDFRLYHEYLPHLGEAAQKILTGFLGYVPDIQHSLYVELAIRKAIEIFEGGFDSKEEQFVRSKSITILKYREEFLKNGKEKADNSPLWGYSWDFKTPQYFLN